MHSIKAIAKTATSDGITDTVFTALRGNEDRNEWRGKGGVNVTFELQPNNTEWIATVRNARGTIIGTAVVDLMD